MPRDYKHHVSKKRAKERPVGSWVSFISGLMCGLLIALLVLVYGEQLRPLLLGAPQSTVLGEHSPAPAGVAVEQENSDEPDILFDFYKILPEMEVEVPDWELERASVDDEEFTKRSYILQVGSFKDAGQAEKAKALLALHGIKSKIQRVVINGRDVWYRVNVGPFHERKEINAIRATLIQQGIDSLLLRTSDTT